VIEEVCLDALFLACGISMGEADAASGVPTGFSKKETQTILTEHYEIVYSLLLITEYQTGDHQRHPDLEQYNHNHLTRHQGRQYKYPHRDESVSDAASHTVLR
jgi:hypothetical protein